jgi:hypothetical protein
MVLKKKSLKILKVWSEVESHSLTDNTMSKRKKSHSLTDNTMSKRDNWLLYTNNVAIFDRQKYRCCCLFDGV